MPCPGFLYSQHQESNCNDLETWALSLTLILGSPFPKATLQTGCTGPAGGARESFGKELGDQVQGAEKWAGPSSLPELWSNLPVLLLRTLLLPREGAVLATPGDRAVT